MKERIFRKGKVRKGMSSMGIKISDIIIDERKLKKFREIINVLGEFDKVIMPRLKQKDRITICKIFKKYNYYVKWKKLERKGLNSGGGII